VRKRSWGLPNFLATVHFVGNAEGLQIITHGPDEETVRGHLHRRYPGIQIESIVAYDFANRWGKKADDRKLAVQAAINGGTKYDFQKNNIWNELKDFLFDLFDGKCAYCECTLLEGSFGAVEHYRPKNPVADVQTHPGYYWLAYEPTNYLPTCTRCNTSKSNFFPLTTGSSRAIRPGEEANEKPLLLNPYRDDPAAHLTFVSADGAKVGPVAKGLTESGKESVRLLALNRPDLLTERLREQEKAVSDYFQQRSLGLPTIPVIEQLKEGTREFSAAALVAVISSQGNFPSLG
jgi:uncharacterized protein (TIGR02646 family)